MHHKFGPMTLTFELDPDMVILNQHTKYLGQKSFSSKAVWRHRCIHH